MKSNKKPRISEPRMKYYIVFVMATIIATNFGLVFNYFQVPTGVLNRYIYIFFVPFILLLVGAKQTMIKYFGICAAGGSLGLFFSKVADFNNFVVMLPQYGLAFLLIYVMYVYLLVNLWKLRRRK